MEQVWLYSLCQCVLSVCIMVVSVRMCAVGGEGGGPGGGGVSSSLRLCLGWVGAVGGAVGVPVSVLLNLRSPRCLYTCITLVCCPLLVRQFTMCLLLLLSLDAHLKHCLADRYPVVVTRRRALCAVLLCWVVSILSSFAQFIGRDVMDTWGGAGEGGTAGLGLEGLPAGGGNWTSPPVRPRPPPPKHPQDRSVIGAYLPYGGFLSKFYVEDLRNFTYAEIHGDHWGLCAADTVLSPRFMVYVYGFTVFLFPLLGLLGLYLDLLCVQPRRSPLGPPGAPKPHAPQARSLALSLCLLVLLCLPLQITQSLALLAPGALTSSWASPLANVLARSYGLVPPLLFTPPRQRGLGERGPLPLSLSHLTPVVAPSRGKAVGRALREAMGATWCPSGPSAKGKVCPGV